MHDQTISRTAAARARGTMPLVALLIGILAACAVIRLQIGDGHWMEVIAIAVMASFMPLTAITYLQFRLPKKQEEFEAMRAALSAQADDSEVFGFVFEQEESGADYTLPIFFVSVFSIMGFYILFIDSGNVLFNGAAWANDPTIGDASSANADNLYASHQVRRNIVAIGMAFLGAYIWSIRFIFRRMMTLDLPPGAYYSVGTRMVYSSFLAVIFQYFLSGVADADNAAMQSQFVVVSFLIGIFPERALSWMRDSLGKTFAKPKDAADPLPLEMIEGISGFHKARLFELGIDSVQNLAHASLMELILKTPFKPRVLVDWMAQARLCLEFKRNTNAIRRAGIRTILDLQEVAEAGDESLLAKVAEKSGVEFSLIRTVYLANSNEASIRRLRKAYDVLNMV